MKARIVRVVAVLAILLGLGMFLFTLAVGDCATFGGTCPADDIERDALGFGATAGALIGGGFVLAVRPTARQVVIAIVVAAIAAAVAAGLTAAITMN